MNVNNVVRTITIKGTAEGVDDVTGKLNKLADAQKNVAVVSDQSAKRVLSLEDAWKRQTLKLDETARSQANVGRETKVADNALREGLITQQQHAERIGLITQRYSLLTPEMNKAVQAHGSLSTQAMALQHSMRSSIEQLAQGVPVTQVLTQQMNHLLYAATGEGGLTGAFKQVGGIAASAFGGIVAALSNPVTAAVTAAAAIGAAFLGSAAAADSAGVNIQRSLSGTGRVSQLTTKDIVDVSNATSNWATMSVKESREAAEAFANAGLIGKDNLTSANKVAADFAKTLGVDLDEGVKILAKDLTSGMAGVDDLGKRLGGLTAGQRDYLKTLDSNLDKTKLQAAAIQFVADNTRKASELTTNWSGAFTRLANAASNALHATSEPPSTGQLGNINQQIGDLSGRRETLVSAGSSPNDIAKLTDEIGRLRLEATKLEAGDLTAKFGEWGMAALKAAEQFTPLRTQAVELEKQLALLKQAQASPETRLTLNPEQNKQLDESARAAEVRTTKTKQGADEADRFNQRVLEISKSYSNVGQETALALKHMDNMLPVARAVGGAARLAAQEQATFNNLIDRGKSSEEAAAVAAKERALAQAQINAQARDATFQLENQLQVASAVGGAARMAAQEEATYNQLVHDGVSSGEASAQAAAQHALAEAQVNAAAKETLFSLQNQRPVVEATTAAEQIQAQAIATKNQLIHDGVDATIAGKIATEQEAQAVAKVNQSYQQRANSLKQQTQAQQANWQGYSDEDMARVNAAKAYQEAIDSGADSTAASAYQSAVLGQGMAKAANNAANFAQQMAAVDAAMAATYEKEKYLPFQSGSTYNAETKSYQASDGTLSQFKPEGYATTTTDDAIARFLASEGGRYEVKAIPHQVSTHFGYNEYVKVNQGQLDNEAAARLYGAGNYNLDQNGLSTPNEQFYNKFYDTSSNSIYQQSGGNAASAANSIISKFGSLQPQELQTQLANIVNLLDDKDPQKQSVLQAEIAKLQTEPVSLARDTLIKNLNDQLKQLTDATNANTQAKLDPLMSQGHQYLDQLKIGYYANADGGILGPGGRIPLMSVNRYADGGIADSPQMAMFGEAGPEAFIPLKNGAVPVAMRGGKTANDNSKTIEQVNNFNFYGVASHDVDRRTARQIAQHFIQAATRAVA
jgi:hypothetical protein